MIKRIKMLDKTLLITCFLLFTLGVLMIISASSVEALSRFGNTNILHYGIMQVVAIMLGLIGGIIIINMPMKKIASFAWLAIIAIIVILVYVNLEGVITRSAQRWVSIFGFQFQPSEFAKPVVIVYLAMILSRFRNKNNASLQTFIASLIPIILILGLIFLQPDLGTTVILMFICATMFYIAPISRVLKRKATLLAITGVVLLVIGSFAFGRVLISENQMDRMVGFHDPCADYFDSGLQVCNSFIAINNSRGIGMGLYASTQKHMYLPDSYTDFIMAITVEELGLIALAGVLICYAIILIRLMMIARHAKTVLNGLVAYGVAMYIFIHILVNLGGISAMIPLTGAPLPFLSYGGSYAISLIAALALAQRIHIENQARQ